MSDKLKFKGKWPLDGYEVPDWETFSIVLMGEEAGELMDDPKEVEATLVAANLEIVQGWQTIDEKSKDGRSYLLYYKNSLGNGRVVRGLYAKKYSLQAHEDSDETNSDWHEGGGEYYAYEGWYEDSETSENILRMTDPTHYKPITLPVAPGESA